jgi:hypothetical protein
VTKVRYGGEGERRGEPRRVGRWAEKIGRRVSDNGCKVDGEAVLLIAMTIGKEKQ